MEEESSVPVSYVNSEGPIDRISLAWARRSGSAAGRSFAAYCPRGTRREGRRSPSLRLRLLFKDPQSEKYPNPEGRVTHGRIEAECLPYYVKNTSSATRFCPSRPNLEHGAGAWTLATF